MNLEINKDLRTFGGTILFRMNMYVQSRNFQSEPLTFFHFFLLCKERLLIKRWHKYILTSLFQKTSSMFLKFFCLQLNMCRLWSLKSHSAVSVYKLVDFQIQAVKVITWIPLHRLICMSTDNAFSPADFFFFLWGI